jgi:hypothetical protein
MEKEDLEGLTRDGLIRMFVDTSDEDSMYRWSCQYIADRPKIFTQEFLEDSLLNFYEDIT